ncbi:MAG: autotransporter-associated beta strand repeat-containing protein [Planctomycetia bacterium]|nr:autotransporter-associated beta strand repeat-containing protein [Planctomycetia bacterium]
MLGTAFSDTGVLNIDTSAGNANVDLNVAIGVNAVNYSLAQLNVTSGTGVITLSNTTGLSWGTGGAYIRQLSLNGRDVNVSAAIPYFGTITVTTSGSNSTFSGNIGTTGSAGTVFTKVGAGALSLTGTNTFTGAMAITGGILQFGRPASLYSGSTANWNAANISTGSGATLAFNVGGGSEFTTGNVTTLLTNLASSTSTANGMNAGSALGFDTSNASGGTFTINDAIADTTGANGGARGLVKLGAGTLVLGGSNGFTGATTISAGVLSFANKNALAATSGISIANGAGLTYTGAADTFARNITVSSGIGAVTNAGVGSLALSGTLTKNGTVLRLRGGSAGITVTGIITGTSLNSDLAVQNGFTTLSTANSYTGPTFINSSGTLALATNNAIPSNSAVTIGGSDAGGDGGPGRLTMGTYTNQIGSLSFSGSGGTIAMAPTSSATSTVVLSATGAVNLAGTSTLDLTSMATGAGLYRLVAGSSVSGTFGSVTGLNSNYLLRYNTVNANEVDAQRKAEFGTITATPAATSIITGGSTAFGYTVSNITPTGGSTLSFASSNGSNVVGSSGGTAGANSTSTNIAGLFFTGTTVGASQTGSFTLTDANAIGSPANGSVTVDVLDHATPGFLASGITNAYTQDVLNIDFGSIDQAAGIQNFTYNLLNLASQTYGAGLTAGLDFTAFTADGDGFTSGLTTFNNLGGGGTSSLFTFTFNPTGQGTFSKTFTLSFYDNQNLSGASSRRDLTINAQVIVVPEPGSLALAGLGVGLVGWSLWARRRIT